MLDVVDRIEEVGVRMEWGFEILASVKNILRAEDVEELVDVPFGGRHLLE